MSLDARHAQTRALPEEPPDDGFCFRSEAGDSDCFVALAFFHPPCQRSLDFNAYRALLHTIGLPSPLSIGSYLWFPIGCCALVCFGLFWQSGCWCSSHLSSLSAIVFVLFRILWFISLLLPAFAPLLLSTFGFAKRAGVFPRTLQKWQTCHNLCRVNLDAFVTHALLVVIACMYAWAPCTLAMAKPHVWSYCAGCFISCGICVPCATIVFGMAPGVHVM